MPDKVVGIEILDLPPGKMIAFRQADFQAMWDCILPLIAERDFALFLIRVSVDGWQLWGTNGGTDDPSTPLHYTPIAEQFYGVQPYTELDT